MKLIYCLAICLLFLQGINCIRIHTRESDSSEGLNGLKLKITQIKGLINTPSIQISF
jgi:hypothetical protein